MTETELNKLYTDVLVDPDFERLEIIRNQPNIFEILGVRDYEIRHSNFLGWLLDPKGNHGVGDYFLKRLLLDVFQDDRSCKNVIDIHSLLKETIIIHRERHNIDILIEFQDTVVVIENKINAKEGRFQLQNYYDLIKERYNCKSSVFVFLTKFGEVASLHESFIELSYNDILTYLNDLITYRSESISSDVIVYIKDYIDNLNKNIMKQDSANALAEKIYKNHKDLFDFIIANKPDPLSVVKNKFSELLRENNFLLGSSDKYYLRFLPRDIFALVPNLPKSKGWKNGEAFLFEFIFNEFEANKIKYQIAISSYHNEIKNDIKQHFEDAGLKYVNEVDNKWFVFEWNEIEFIVERFNEQEYINQVFNNWYLQNKSKISSLIEIIIKNKEKFKQ